MSDGVFLYHTSCPVCGSSDANAVYSTGTTFCFSCETWGRLNGEQQQVQRRDRVEGLLTDLEPISKTLRGIKDETFRKFQYQYGTYNGKKVHVAPYFLEGALVAQHLRTPNKEFPWRGETKRLELFGQHLWKNSGDYRKRIVVTEGEIDCMSVSQAFNNKWPVVSVPNGAQSAAKYIKQNLEFLEGYEEIVLGFDNDEPGKAAVKECAQLFTPGKVRIVDWSPYKDANDILKENKASEITQKVFDAQAYRPDGIWQGADLWDIVDKPIEWGLSYPWESLTNATYGARLNELVGLGAGTGMGKTDVFKEIITHFIVHHKVNVGIIFLEESNRDTALGIMSKYASKLFHIPGANYTEEEKRAAFDATLGTGRVFLYDHFGFNDYETIKSKIRYMAVACGCKYIFLDHITALVSGDRDGDERKELDFIMTDLASLVRALNINIHFITHLSTPEGKPHEEGGRVYLKHLRGSRAIGQWSSFIFALERNQQAEDLEERHTTTFRILKDRYTGRSTGFTFKLKYNQETGRMTEVEGTFDFDNEGDTPF